MKRTFELMYTVRLPASRAPIRLWVPVAPSDPWQEVRLPEIEGTQHYELREHDGNRMFYADLPPAGDERTLSLRQVVCRLERRSAAPQPTGYAEGALTGLTRELQADERVPLDPELASRVANGAQLAPAEFARRLFEHLLREFEYDSAGCTPERCDQLGDLAVACSLKRGTCTEFHGLYAGAARAFGIPTRFEFGFNVPAGSPVGRIAGYHCWVEVFLPEVGWFPVDVTEAWKRSEPQARAFYFGALDANRVRFTRGRDVTLSPPSRAPNIDRFIFPVAESDESVEVGLEFHYRDHNADGG